MNKNLLKNKRKVRRKKGVRKSVFGSSVKPRVSVYRSNKHIFAQIIDDVTHSTLIGLSDRSITIKANKTDKAKELGKKIGELAMKEKIQQVVFDRGGNKYHGRVKALAEGLRESGLKF